MKGIFAKRLKAAREKKELSQHQLAKILDVTQASIAKYESGEREPNLKMLGRLCKTLGVSADYLIGNHDDPSRRLLPDYVEVLHDTEFDGVPPDDIRRAVKLLRVTERALNEQ